MLERPAVYTVVGRIKTTLGEPGDISGNETSRPNCMEWPVPVKDLASHLHRVSAKVYSRHVSESIPLPRIYQIRDRWSQSEPCGKHLDEVQHEVACNVCSPHSYEGPQGE